MIVKLYKFTTSMNFITECFQWSFGMFAVSFKLITMVVKFGGTLRVRLGRVTCAVSPGFLRIENE